MRQGADPVGVGTAVTAADPRVTRVGRLLRRFALDELPNLFNVLRGEMAIVGPRATLPAQVELYTPRQRRRLELKPGVTGWAQIHGRAGIPWEERIELDVWYVEHRSLRLDLRILARTPAAAAGAAPATSAADPYAGSSPDSPLRQAAERERASKRRQSAAWPEASRSGTSARRTPRRSTAGSTRPPRRRTCSSTRDGVHRGGRARLGRAGDRAVEDPKAEDRKWAVEVEGIDEPVGFHGALRARRQTAPELGAIMGDERGARQGRRPRGRAPDQPEGVRGVRRPQGLRPHPGDQRGGQEGGHLQRLAAGGRPAQAGRATATS